MIASISSTQGIQTHIWLIFMVNVGKHTINGLFGVYYHKWRYIIRTSDGISWVKCEESRWQMIFFTLCYTIFSTWTFAGFWVRGFAVFREVRSLSEVSVGSHGALAKKWTDERTWLVNQPPYHTPPQKYGFNSQPYERKPMVNKTLFQGGGCRLTSKWNDNPRHIIRA